MELLDVIDENDVVLRQEGKEKKFTEGFISRNIVIWLRNRKGEFIVTLRAAHKEVDPGKYDVAVCGHVQAGESYEYAAQRELQEELGISCPLRFLRKVMTRIPYQNTHLPFMTAIFTGMSRETIRLNQESTHWKTISFADLCQEIERNPQQFAAGLIQDFQAVKHLLQEELF